MDYGAPDTADAKAVFFWSERTNERRTKAGYRATVAVLVVLADKVRGHCAEAGILKAGRLEIICICHTSTR